MTYPQHIDPRYAQQYQASQMAYPPAPPQGLPTYPAQVQQAYGQVAAAAPPQGGQSLPTNAPALGQTRGAGGGVSPKARHLVGRTIIIEPIRVDENAKDDKGNPRPEAHFHLTVCDGGPLEFGDNQDRDPAKQHGPTKRVDTPCRFTNVNDYGYGFVQETRDALARGDLAAVGVFEQGTQGNKPFLLTKPGRDLAGKDRPDGDQRFALAGQIWQAIFDKTFRSPEPISLVAPPAQTPPQVAYAQPAAPQGYNPGYAPTAGPAQIPAYAAGQGYAQAYAQQAAPGFQTPYAAANPGTGPYGDGQPQPAYQPQAYNPAAYAAPAPQQQSAPPANAAFEAWLATLSPEQRAAQMAALAGQQQVYGQAAGPGL